MVTGTSWVTLTPYVAGLACQPDGGPAGDAADAPGVTARTGSAAVAAATLTATARRRARLMDPLPRVGVATTLRRRSYWLVRWLRCERSEPRTRRKWAGTWHRTC